MSAHLDDHLPAETAPANPFERRIGYKFRNSLLLAEALTHPSLSFERKTFHFDNQRLEFLGDAVLQLVVTHHLYRLFPTFSEGQLTKLRSRIVSREGLKKHALALDLGRYLMLGRGEEASHGRDRSSNLADAFEALVGALYLDSDLETVRRFVLRVAGDDLAALTREPGEHNPKGELQEILQALSPQSPGYEVVAETGPDHLKEFVCRVLWEGREIGRGTGQSKKQAEINAAARALELRVWSMAQQRPNQAAGIPADNGRNSPPS
ncbi:MAG: ribonuclease III [Chthoniobacterales bacterium]